MTPGRFATEVSVWMYGAGREIAAEVDRLWPEENDPGYRAQALGEEAGEVSRAITKRRHAIHAVEGLCKGLNAEQWSGELRKELAQALGVILDIMYREEIDPVPAVEECIEALRVRPIGS